MTTHKHKIGRWQGAAMMATTLLGTGVFILPQITIDIAGSYALYAWLLLTLAIIPVTYLFAKLAANYPNAGGPAHFVEQAFGPLAGRTIGLLFLLVVPVGAPAALIMTFQFVDSLVVLNANQLWLCQLATLLFLFVINLGGLQLSARLQFMLTFGIVAILLLLISTTLDKPVVALSNHVSEPFNATMMAAGIAFWSFLGVEAMSHLSEDFKDAKRDAIPAMLIGTVLVGVLYLVCCYTLLKTPITGKLAIAELAKQTLGETGFYIINILGIAGGLATVNVYTASVARLIWRFAEDGIFPSYLRYRSPRNVPTTALASLIVIMMVVLSVSHFSDLVLEDLINWVNGVFVVIYFSTALAALKLLSKRNRPFIYLSLLVCALLGYGIGAHMAYAGILLLAVIVILKVSKKRTLRVAA